MRQDPSRQAYGQDEGFGVARRHADRSLPHATISDVLGHGEDLQQVRVRVQCLATPADLVAFADE